MPYYFCHRIKHKGKWMKPGDLVSDPGKWKTLEDSIQGGVIRFSDKTPKEMSKEPVFVKKPMLSRRLGTLKPKTKSAETPAEPTKEPEVPIEKMTQKQMYQQRQTNMLMAQLLK